jgi:hypothetical protein
MSVKKSKTTKARKTLLKNSLRKVANTKSSDDLNEVAARLILQSERNTVTQAAALLIRKIS